MAQRVRHPESAGGAALLLAGLLVVSGFAALVYQVLWVRQLTLLLGSTTQAVALAIAIFFAGLAAGGAYWGHRSAHASSGLRLFGLLEIGVAATALGHFLLLDAYHGLYPALYGWIGSAPALDLLAKFMIATVILFPPSFLMGGTLPAVSQHLVRHRGQLGQVGSRLYALNTAGSAAGALAAGFVLPLTLGFRGAYLFAVALDLIVGCMAVGLARARKATPTELSFSLAPGPGHAQQLEGRTGSGGHRRSRLPRVAVVVAFVSGFATLAVEVLWTRLFAQVLQNSVYTYALVLTTFLLALAAGATIANWLCRIRRVPAETILIALLALAGVATATSPWVFHTVTDGLAYVGSELGWNAYLASVTTIAMVVMFPAATVFGTVLPFLLRTLESRDEQPGQTVGRLVAVNTTGAVLGSLAAGFVLLPALGTTRSLLAAAGLYPLALVVVGLPAPTTRRALAFAGAALAAAMLAVVPREFDMLRLRTGTDERLVELREGVQATVAVIDTPTSRSIRVNNYYTLGSSGARHSERNQTLIPLLTHTHTTAPTSVFFLGMGTGITAGAALSFPLDRIVVCELVDDVIDAARDHFSAWTLGLFDDDRVRIHAEDGRTCLRRSYERHDLIISDLFTPWKAGTGSLYTLEHYTTARERLEPGGRYVQWIPLYQVSEGELGSIARTMGEVFDEVVLWRGDLFASRSIVALVGHVDRAPIDVAAVVANVQKLRPEIDPELAEALLLRMYVGNITASGYFSDHPINTDVRPFIEYTAPRTHREARVGAAELLVGAAREQLYDELLTAMPPGDDPYLATLTDQQIDHVLAGRSYAAYAFANSSGRVQEADDALRQFHARAPEHTRRARSPARLLLGGTAD